MKTITTETSRTLRKPKFHIGDKVILFEHPEKGCFKINGIICEATGRYVYSSNDDIEAGWMDEGQLEFYFSQTEKPYCEEIELTLHKIEELAEHLGDQACELDDRLDGIPRPIQAEMDRVAYLVNRRFRI